MAKISSTADLNYLVESWHGIRTCSETEAIVDRPKGKGIADYQRLMQRCFQAYCRVLKPGRWITVVFHNSKSAVWNAIQEAMLAAGFVVADVRTLDKQQGSYRQVTSTAVKQDLVISAYKPNGGLEDRFRLKAGTEDGAWDFVRTHMRQLPVFVARDGSAEVIAERQGYLLFDRMVAFHVQRGVTVPLSATEFQDGLTQRFPERDGMFFLPSRSPSTTPNDWGPGSSFNSNSSSRMRNPPSSGCGSSSRRSPRPSRRFIRTSSASSVGGRSTRR